MSFQPGMIGRQLAILPSHDDRPPGGPKGDRVKIGMTGKFLPFKYYGAKGNEQGLGYREE
jgi:hypothetical protein